VDGSVAAAYRRIARRYCRVAVVYLALGMLLGAAMFWFGNDNFQFLHGHMLLIGAAAFAGYGAGFSWLAGRPDTGPPGAAPGTASIQFWLANVGLVGLLAGAVLPVGLGLDRIAALFGVLEAAAGIVFAVLMRRALAEPGR
jgi:hypothetical protein